MTIDIGPVPIPHIEIIKCISAETGRPVYLVELIEDEGRAIVAETNSNLYLAHAVLDFEQEGIPLVETEPQEPVTIRHED